MPPATPDGRLPGLISVSVTHNLVNPSPEYYSTNLFQIDFPEQALRWLDNIGQQNVESLRSLRLWVGSLYREQPRPSPHPNPLPGVEESFDMLFGSSMRVTADWRTIFERISQMKHLRTLDVVWDADTDNYMRWGGGADVRLVRALGKMDFLDSLKISGCFAKEWPAYLNSRMKGLQIGDYAQEWRADYQGRLGNLSP